MNIAYAFRMKTITKILLATFSRINLIFEALNRLHAYANSIYYANIQPDDLIKFKSVLNQTIFIESVNLVRVGSSHDGGYVLAKLFSEQQSVISLGIGSNSDFEMAISKYVSKVFCFDGSIRDLPQQNLKLEFEKKHVKKVASKSSTSLANILQGIKENHLILKIDIEGAEWEVLESTPQSDLMRFDQIVGEFHGFTENRSGQVGLKKKVQILEKLLENFEIINLHPNNWGSYRIIKGTPVPDVIEFTFINKNLLNSKNFSKSSKFYSTQNSPCNPEKFEYHL